MIEKKKFRFIPEYSVFPLILVVVWNQLVYSGAMFLTKNWTHYNFELGIDQKIPFVPWTVSIYLLCYLFWIVNYILCARQDKSSAYRFLFADILAKAVCLVFFLAIPTTNVRPVISGHTIWEEIMRLVYHIDSASNLFPSIHCLVSWFCFIGVRKQKQIPAWYRAASCVMAIAVFISTLTTKQHVIVDVIGGVVLAEICYYITGRMKIFNTLRAR